MDPAIRVRIPPGAMSKNVRFFLLIEEGHWVICSSKLALVLSVYGLDLGFQVSSDVQDRKMVFGYTRV